MSDKQPVPGSVWRAKDGARETRLVQYVYADTQPMLVSYSYVDGNCRCGAGCWPLRAWLDWAANADCVWSPGQPADPLPGVGTVRAKCYRLNENPELVAITNSQLLMPHLWTLCNYADVPVLPMPTVPLLEGEVVK